MEEIKEEWKPVEGFQGLYEISNLGRVKSFVVNTQGRILKQHVSKHGYLVIRLTNTSRKSFFVHRLVATAFCEKYTKELEVNHKDGNKLNNIFTNLEWTTRSYNVKHAIDMGLRKYAYGKDNVLSKKYIVTFPDEHTEQILCLAEFCRLNNLHEENMNDVLNGKYKQNKGFKIERYIEDDQD